jgi:hypothetical protein
MTEQIIGNVSDFFARPVVAAIELTAALKVGDKIHFKGAGDSIGVKIDERVRKGDSVYKVSD